MGQERSKGEEMDGGLGDLYRRLGMVSALGW